MMSGSSSTQPPQKLYNPGNDAELQPANAIKDGVSSLSFSPRVVGDSSLLAVTTWDNDVLCWEVSSGGQSQPKANTHHAQPVLCSCWSADGSTVFTGGCDNSVKSWNLHTNQTQQVGQHDAPVKHCFFIPERNLLVTGGWDKTVKYWDMRSPGPVHTQQLPERVYAMDVKAPILVVGTADKQIHVFNLSQPQIPIKTLPSSLKWQTKCVSCFPDKQGFLVGSIEGKVSVQHFEEPASRSKNFTFRCHRETPTDVYAVNSFSFHPVHGSFASTGSDGGYNFWDKESKSRLKAAPAKCQYAEGVPAPIPCGTFNSVGNIFAYAVSYDWSKGLAAFNPATMTNHVLIHTVQDAEVRRKGNPPSTQ